MEALVGRGDHHTLSIGECLNVAFAYFPFGSSGFHFEPLLGDRYDTIA